VLTAWRGSTEGGRVGVAVGDVADLVLLEADPLAATGSGPLRRARVLATAIAGRFTYRDV
jgi:predicted amidohydrolase YtcJ